MTKMIDRPQGPKPPSPVRPYVAPAPILFKGKCSDCGVPAVSAGDGDLKVCPNCYAVLWQSSKAEDVRKIAAEQRKLAEAARRELEERLRREEETNEPNGSPDEPMVRRVPREEATAPLSDNVENEDKN